MDSCRWDALVKRFGSNEHHPWRFSDTHGETMSLHTYDKYCRSVDGALTDDAPLAVYDSQLFEGDDERCVVSDDYTVPTCFDGVDLFVL